MPKRSTRRAFLEAVGRLGAAAWTARALADTRPTGTIPEVTSRPSTTRIAPGQKSIVAHLVSREVIPSTTIYEDLLREMIEESLRLSISGSGLEQAWGRIIPPEGIIAVKLDPVAASGLKTRLPLARQIVHSLITSGQIDPGRIMLVDVPNREQTAIEEALATRLGRPVRLRSQVYGFNATQLELSGGATHLAAWLTESTAVVNVPSLKTHNVGGLSGCLMNLAYSIVKGPGQFYGRDCTPFVGEVLSLETVRGKPMVHIMNAVRAIYDGGPDPRPDGVWEHCGLLVGTDPVAVDAMGLEVINDRRSDAGLPLLGGDLGKVPHLIDAARRGLGTDDQDYIDLRHVTVG